MPRGGIDGIPSTCDERDRGHWYPKSRVFLLWTVSHLTDTGFAGRGSIWPFVGFRDFVKLMVLRLFWLRVIEAMSPELCPCFFQVDLAPAILRFLRRDRIPPLLPVSVSHHPTFSIPSIPATYASTDSRDPDYRDTVTSLPYYNQPSPRIVI